MKSTIILIITLFITASGFAQSTCSKFYPFKEGTKSQITNYNKKGKVAGTIDYSITSMSKTGDKQIATMISKIADDKGKTIVESKYDVSCDGSVVSIDFKSMMNPQMLEQFKNLKYEMSGSNLDFPNNLSVGQTLPDANMHLKVSISGINMEMDFNINDRKVISKENVTSPAGTFPCYVITYSTDFSSMGVTQNGTAKQWISEGVGMVKQEDYDKSGEVSNSSVLTSFSN